MKKVFFKKNKGITLIALVITIVVLIILATISINAVLGEDGLIQRVEKAREHQANAEASDSEILDIFDKYIVNALGGSGNSEEEIVEQKIIYTIEDIDVGSKVVKVKYNKEKQEVTTQQIESKLEDLKNITITDDIREGCEQEAKNNNISYDEYLLEIMIWGGNPSGDDRAEIQSYATANGTSYKQLLIDVIEETYDISFTGVNIEDVEAKLEYVQGITITDEIRTNFENVSTSNGITYRECLLEILLKGAPLDEDSRNTIKEYLSTYNPMPYEDYLVNSLENKGIYFDIVISKATNGTHQIQGETKEFIATRNGTYMVEVIEIDGTITEVQVNVTGIEEEKFSNIYEATTTYTDANGAIAKIPAGFAVGTSKNINTIENGLVITDAVDSNGYSIGNEFVWIPVESESVLARTLFDNTTGQPIIGLSEKYTEPFNYTDDNGTNYVGYETEESEYDTMKTKVLEHKGFYIGRYEAGVDTIVLRNDETEAQTVVLKRGVAPYNYLPWGTSVNDPSEVSGQSGAVYLAKKMYENSSSVTSTLTYGCQWDAMCRYIGDSNRKTSRKDNPEITGRTIGDKSKNIYDLAGNCIEWTMEANDTKNRVVRGGSFKTESSIANRTDYWITWDIGRTVCSFRPTLYVN